MVYFHPANIKLSAAINAFSPRVAQIKTYARTLRGFAMWMQIHVLKELFLHLIHLIALSFEFDTFLPIKGTLGRASYSLYLGFFPQANLYQNIRLKFIK